MSVLVVWASRLGATHGIAERIVERLEADGAVARAEPAETAVIRADDDAIVIGSAIYGGRWLAPALEFIDREAVALRARPVWLFSDGPVGDLAARGTPQEPQDIDAIRRSIHPREHRTFGGAFDRDAIEHQDFGRVERFVARHLVPEGDYRDWPAIDRWVDGIVTWLTLGRELSEPAGVG